MPTKNLRILTFEDRLLHDPSLLTPGTLLWLLRDYQEWLLPDWLFVGWRGESKTGRPAWPARTLMSLLVLRHSESGQTRKGATERAGNDKTWRAALRLPWEETPPKEKSLREFEAFLQEPHPAVNLPRITVVFEHIVRLCIDAGMIGEAPIWVIDSTPMWCFGAVQGTVRLLGDGLRRLGRRWARATGSTVEEVAREWNLPLLLAKSTKGHFQGIDWSDARVRSEVLAQLVTWVNDCTERVQRNVGEVRQNKHKPLLRLSRNLLRVVDEDLEATEDGLLRVKRRATSARLISLTDPEAQHFRKSKSKVCSGYKLHALGDAVSGLIAALEVTPGGEHDNTQACPLITRSKALYDGIEEVLGDAAYGGMRVRKEVREQAGIEILAPPARNTRKGDKLGKEDVAIDFDEMIATCPGGVSTNNWQLTKRGQDRVPTFYWTKDSAEHCGCRSICPVHSGRRRHLQLHPEEQEQRRVRGEWQQPDVRARYRLRAQGERLMRELTRRGARKACGWGLHNARSQATCCAIANNLQLLARLLAEREHRRRRAS